jgi:hypothetical protein
MQDARDYIWSCKNLQRERRALINEELRNLQQINQIKQVVPVRYAASITNRNAYGVLVWNLKLTDYIVRKNEDGRAML